MFVIRRKSDGKYWTDKAKHYLRSYAPAEWEAKAFTDDITKARPFRSTIGALGSRCVHDATSWKWNHTMNYKTQQVKQLERFHKEFEIVRLKIYAYTEAEK